jgi:AraC-like DNA-binding protein
VAVLFDTAILDPRERPESWSEAHGRIFFPIGVRFAVAGASLGRIQGEPCGPLGAYRVVSDPSIVRRSRAAIREYDPEQFLVAMPLRGHTVIEQEDRMSVFGTGDLSSWDSSHPFSVTHTEAFDLLLLVVPRTLLGPRRDLICRRTAGRIAHGSRIGALAAPFFRQVWEALGAGDVTASQQEDLADGVIALVRALHHGEAPETAPARHLPGSALLPQLKAYVEQNLGDPRLGPESIAQAHYISTRYLHKLFARDGVSVSDWVRHRRLEACRRDLRDSALAHETISEVARRWGLSNPAHFSRVFRDAYGCTPSELRRAVAGT